MTMTRRQQRICAVILIACGTALAVALSLFALRGNVTFFYSPADLYGERGRAVTPDRPVRLGGLVEEGSVEKDGDILRFSVTDHVRTVSVLYKGIVPNLFREGQGVIATGSWDAPEGLLTATELLAKHDENYMPPEVARALKKGGQRQEEPVGDDR